MLGYDELNIDLLTQDFITIAQTQEVSETNISPHGKKYIIYESLQTPIGRLVEVRTVWIIDKGQSRPRFVTAYPN